MPNQIQLNYTEAAQDKKHELMQSYLNRLEGRIRDSKGLPGDELIEVTARDVEEAARNLNALLPRRKMLIQNVLTLYIWIGIAIIVYGIFYSEIREIFRSSPERIMYIFSGSILVLFSVWYRKVLAQRLEAREAQRRVDIENYFISKDLVRINKKDKDDSAEARCG